MSAGPVVLLDMRALSQKALDMSITHGFSVAMSSSGERSSLFSPPSNLPNISVTEVAVPMAGTGQLLAPFAPSRQLVTSHKTTP